MTFPNAYHGVKKIFVAEILSVIASACSLFAAISGLITLIAAASSTAGPDAAVAAGAGTAVFLIASTVLFIISYIMELVGLHQAGKDENNFMTAFWITIFALIMAVVTGVINAINSGNGIADDITTAFQDVVKILVFVLVIQGVSVLAEKLNNSDLQVLGTRIMYIVVVMYGISLLAKLVPAFFGISDATTTIGNVLDLVAAVLSIVSIIVYIVYLGKAKNMLQNN